MDQVERARLQHTTRGSPGRREGGSHQANHGKVEILMKPSDLIRSMNQCATGLFQLADLIDHAARNEDQTLLATQTRTTAILMRANASIMRRDAVKAKQRRMAERRVAWVTRRTDPEAGEDLIRVASQLDRAIRRQIEAEYRAFRALPFIDRFLLIAPARNI